MRWLPALGAAALVLLTVAACGGSNDESASPPPPTTTLERSTAQDDGRERAPATSGESLDGEAIALADFRGRPVLVNVWSSW